ncbi:histidine phosphatase family protein [Aestuariibacter halophilus]|uniref:Histidine phosphatase family protein n=1 Tax=Fluctibacter halophilus TaxID=226011 RepID=A0ABS8GC58_9ALTE|nr:histidine phosphatase family protein [Aestuariibacter halophilus]MCC2618149.1 histidine phosphatase family protein [Aestuariibacter halophilus]
MSCIYLIRHGQASFGQHDYDCLSPLGEQQAARLGEALAARQPPFDHVIVGSMKRHRQTASLCLTQSDQQLPEAQWQTDANWNEYDHQNIIAAFNPTFCDPVEMKAYLAAQPDPKLTFATLFNKAMNRWLSGQHDGDYIESWEGYQQRIQQALAKTLEAAPEHKSIAVFTSGGPISLVAQRLLGIPEHHLMKLNWTLLNAGITKLVHSPRQTFLAALNDHGHFEGEFQSMLTYK